MAISTRVEPVSGHGWQTGFVRLWRGVRWMLWLSGALLLSLLTGTVFYIITGLSQWAALLLLSILVLVALFRRWPPARRAMLADRLMQAEPWIWAGALIAGVGTSVVLAWRGEISAAWLMLGLVGTISVIWAKCQYELTEEGTVESGKQGQLTQPVLNNGDRPCDQLLGSQRQLLEQLRCVPNYPEDQHGSLSFFAPDWNGKISVSTIDHPIGRNPDHK